MEKMERGGVRAPVRASQRTTANKEKEWGHPKKQKYLLVENNPNA